MSSRRVVAASKSNVKKTVRLALPHLKPAIDERKAKIQEYGLGEDWTDKPVSRDSWRAQLVAYNTSNFRVPERHAPVGPRRGNPEGS